MAPKLELGFDVSKLQDLTPLQRWLITAGVVILVVVLVVLLLYMPKSKKMTQLKGDIGRLESELAKKENIARNLDVYKKEYEKLNRKLEEFLKKLPKASEVEKVLVDIGNAGKEVNLNFVQFSPKDELPNPQGLYATIPIELGIEGKFHGIALFLDKVAKMERIVKPIDIVIKPTTKKEKFYLEVKLMMETYRYYEGPQMQGGKR